ncbi:hypothetical protein [Vibrio cholerae]|uniref:hypothetical protein n=1 Tax=Vibrio cholerae TaxID=666 RepID=UPI001D56C6FF|nr:hypothetical protein [Vibrio cholerae]EHU0373397.1 hypothetical protein [Vibrio cholerae]EJL6946281.1 hypothetical protein [Vibrio cholerae]MEB5555101.1 hypothetical protein [Vibrio cholerae]MEB5620731.1 hypothetical protein [Vibrio cholerae]
MAGIGRGTRGIDTKLLYNLTAGTKAASGFTLEVGDITSIGDIKDSANTTEVTVYGEGYTNTFTTVKNVGQIDLEFLANTEDAGQTALETLYANQNTASFAIRLVQGERQTDYMFDGQVSSFGISSAADDVVRYAVSLVVHGKVHKENKTGALPAKA